MNRVDLQHIAEKRKQEAVCLFEAGHFEGAYYLLGYALECAIKACVAKQFREHDFPDLQFVRKSHTHDLSELLGLSGLKDEYQKHAAANSSFARKWTVVANWSEQSRYLAAIPEPEVRDFFSAVLDFNDGVLPWLKMWW